MARFVARGLLALALLLSTQAASAQSAQPPVAAGGPGAAASSPLARLEGELTAELAALQAGVQGLAAPRAALQADAAALRGAVVDLSILRGGLQACFAAPSQERCAGAAVTQLQQYLASQDANLGQRLQRMLDTVDGLRRSISDLVLRATTLAERATRSRQEVERVVQAAYLEARRVDEQPLESGSAKRQAVAQWELARADRERVLASVAGLEAALRPLEAQLLAQRSALLDELALVAAPRQP